MNQSYEIGDVVLCHVKFSDSSETKQRPVIILEKYSDGKWVCSVTGTNLEEKFPGRFPGRWIEKGSDDYKEMGLSKSSFVHYSKQAEIPDYMFHKKIGTYPYG